MQYPDYSNGLVNLTNSILRSFGAPCFHPSLPYLDTILDKKFQNVVLMLFDGMGTDALARHLPEDSFLRRHHVKTISSVFPSTTTAALTSIESGLTPLEHGWLGWSVYFKELDKNVELFRNTVKDSNGAQAAEYNVAGRYIPYEPISAAINRAGIGTMVTVSPFGGRRVSKHEELFQSVRQICDEAGRKFIYAYWYEPDAIMHETGCESPRTKEMIEKIDQSVEALCAVLSDTLVIVIADHGHIDTRQQFVTDYPDLVNAIIRPPSIEGRAAAFYVKEEYKTAFPQLFGEIFGDAFLLLTRDEVISGGIFGPGTQHPRFLESIGDFLAIAISDVVITNSHQSKQFVSNHAGLTPQEMNVPLILVET